MLFWNIFIAATVLSFFTTLIVRRLALHTNVVDTPSASRKIHRQATPLLGGVSIFVSFFLLLWLLCDVVLARGLIAQHLVGFSVGALLLVFGGALDDRYNLPPRLQIIFPLLASVSVLAGGVSITTVTNPVGGLVQFGAASGAFLTVVWLLGMMYTTKLLDGVDGLVSGLGVISGGIIFLFTLTTRYYQPDVGLMALVFAGVCLGFLLLNFHPAKIFLGEGGSLLIGFIIAVLAIISGGKIAIALLIMGIPIMDVIWIIARRLAAGKNPFKTADRKHLHHRFLDMGLTQRQTVFIYYLLAILFGSLTLFLQSKGKLIALGVLAIVMAGIALLSIFIPKKLILGKRNPAK